MSKHRDNLDDRIERFNQKVTDDYIVPIGVSFITSVLVIVIYLAVSN